MLGLCQVIIDTLWLIAMHMTKRGHWLQVSIAHRSALSNSSLTLLWSQVTFSSISLRPHQEQLFHERSGRNWWVLLPYFS
jgi:hypothetical protein